MDQTVSVVIVSRNRPEALRLCLLGISQLQYPRFEVVVVADPQGIAAAQEMPFAEHLKLVEFDEPNISAARNLGITHAAGEIIAFIDDDAVPEPLWLHHLIAPAAKAEVAAMGGFVRGRNGISFQWKARRLDAMGHANPLDIDPDEATVLHPPKGSAVKTEGTNMAVRRSVLVALGGFDPAFHYFLDETDLNMRLARAGHATALVPLAEVHHGFKANAMRTHARVPTDLFDIGASWAVFQRKHIIEGNRATHWGAIRTSERQRLLRHLIAGTLEPRDIKRLIKRLDDGFEVGKSRPFGTADLPGHPADPFLPFPARKRHNIWVPTRPLTLGVDLKRAEDQVAQGAIVTLCSLSPTAMFHHIRFTSGGVWLQRGGLFGRSDRNGPLFRMVKRSRRQTEEKMRIARQRGLSEEKE